jgi:hypothetical protein
MVHKIGLEKLDFIGESFFGLPIIKMGSISFYEFLIIYVTGIVSCIQISINFLNKIVRCIAITAHSETFLLFLGSTSFVSEEQTEVYLT